MERYEPREHQPAHVATILAEPTRQALLADEVGAGKTLVTVEVLLNAPDLQPLEGKRVLLIGLANTLKQWNETLQRQSQGVAPMILPIGNKSKAQRVALEAFRSGAPGVFFATIQFLMANDFETRFVLDKCGRPKIKKSGKGELRFKARVGGVHGLKWREPGVIGPAQEPAFLPFLGPAEEPVFETYRHHLFTWRTITEKHPLDAIIYDEAHLTSNRKATSLDTLQSFRGHDGTLAGIRKIAMSATWSGNNFSNAWTLPFWLWGSFNTEGGRLKDGGHPIVPASYWKWDAQYCAKQPQLDKDGKTVYVRGKQMLKVVGEKDAGVWVKTLPCYLRVETKDLSELNMPAPPEPMIVTVPATRVQARQFEELQEQLLAWVQNWEGDREPLVVDVPVVLRTRLRQVALAELSLDENGETFFRPDAKSAKLMALAGILQHELFAGQPVVIFTDSKLMANLTAQRMANAGLKVASYTGDTKSEHREAIKQAFIDGEIQYIVGSVQAMGTGLDGLQKVCARIIWLSLPDGDPKLRTQALGRVYRPGRTMKYGGFHHVEIHMENSLDVEVLERLLAKATSIQASVGAHNLKGNAA